MDDKSNITKNTILEALNLNPSTSSGQENDNVKILNCIFCEFHIENDICKTQNKSILQHMFMEHRLVISDVNDIANLSEYLNFWKKEFKGK